MRKLLLIGLIPVLFYGCYDIHSNPDGYYENGKFYYYNGYIGEGELVDTLKQGLWAFYNQDQLPVSKGEFVNDTLHGEWTFWYITTVKHSVGSYDMGVKVGEWKYWHDNGQLMSEGSHSRETRTGPWTFWYANGQLKEKRLYRGEDQLLLNSWFPNGEPMVVDGNGEYWYIEFDVAREKGMYKDSLPVGVWEYFDANGNLLRQDQF